MGCSPAESRYSRSTWSGLTPNKTASWLFGRRGELSGVDHILADVAPVTCQNCGSNYPETMKTECLKIAELGGLWETVEIYPYRLTDELATGKAECAGGEHDNKFQQRLTHCSVLIQQGGGKRRADILAVEIKPGIVFHPTKYGSLFPHLFASSRHCGGKQRTGIIPL